jgi:hypothetical protein
MCICESNAKLLGLVRIMEAGTQPLVLGKPKIITLTDEVHNK